MADFSREPRVEKSKYRLTTAHTPSAARTRRTNYATPFGCCSDSFRSWITYNIILYRRHMRGNGLLSVGDVSQSKTAIRDHHQKARPLNGLKGKETHQLQARSHLHKPGKSSSCPKCEEKEVWWAAGGTPVLMRNALDTMDISDDGCRTKGPQHRETTTYPSDLPVLRQNREQLCWNRV